MALVKREKKKEGIKILAYGESGSGKSPFGLSFPDQLLFDSDSSTSFYEGDNVIMESTALSFAEMLVDFDKIDRDKQLMSEVKTISVDSMTRFVEKQEHAALKVAENRARQNGRDVAGETISPKERNVMKVNYDRVFARLIGYAKQGKNIVIIAERKVKTENKIDANGNTTFVNVGFMPNLPKDSEYDFDVIIHTYKKDGKSFGTVEKDRTGAFKIGEEIEMPNYSHWEEAIKKAQDGRQRDASEIRNFDDVVNEDVQTFDADAGKVKEYHDKMIKILIDIKDQDWKNKNVTPEVRKLLNGVADFRTVSDVVDLEKVLNLLEEKHEEYVKFTKENK